MRVPAIRVITTITITALTAVFAVSGSTGQKKLDLPEVKRFTLDNGIRGFYVYDELPRLTITVSASYGRMNETPERAGLSDLIVETLSMSGSEKYPGASAFRRIESLGGELSIDTSWESTTISVQILSRFREEAFEVIADLIRAPAFSGENLESARDRRAEAIRRRDDDPFNRAFDRMRSIVFSGSGYGAVPSMETLNSFTLDDVTNTWNEEFRGSNLLLGVSSSLSYEEIRAASVEYLGPVKKGFSPETVIDYSSVPETIRNSDNKIYLYVSDIPQATVMVGTIAPSIASPDLYSLTVMNYVLGGGSFSSRLMREIRVKRGLAYSTQSIYRPRGETGVFLAFARTRNENSADVLSLILDSINDISSHGVSAEELQWAGRFISNSYIFRFETEMDLLANYFNIERYGLSDDYYETYLEKISAVSGESVQRTGAALFSYGTVKVVVGGRECAELLETFGDVIIIEDNKN